MFVVSLLTALLGACAMPLGGARSTPQVSMPATAGWYNGERVYYITTEITDPTMARNAGITYAPRLTDAIPEYPKPPTTKSVLERVYKFPDNEQGAVFASAPRPPGPGSVDTSYSPLWLAYMVRWTNREHQRVLTNEEAILAAVESREVSVERTNIVINCPIVATASGGVLPGSRITP